MGRLTLGLLGPAEVRHDGRPVAFATRKAMALLAYLAVEEGHHSREALATLLWPEANAESARTTLRSTLRFLRAGLGPADAEHDHLLAGRETLAFASGADHDVDVRHLLDTAELVRDPHARVCLPLLRRTREAASLYRGEFLTGLSLPDAPEFDDWLRARRAACERSAVVLLDRLSSWLCATGDVAGALEPAQRWLALDGFDEVAHRRLIELHLMLGDRSAAVRAYERCARVLRDELGVEPGQETSALAEQARSDAPVAQLASAVDLDDLPLVGRIQEHAHLASALREARRGRSQVILIDGEAGIGKSRLLAAFRGWARAQGVGIAWGRALEAGGRIPYQPVAEALRARLADVPSPGDVLEAHWWAYLRPLLPELVTTATNPTLESAAGAGQLCEATVRLFQALAIRSPLVLCIDDVHWSDVATLDLLLYLARSAALKAARLLLVLSVRSEELATQTRLADWVEALDREIPIQHLSLGPLDAAETTELSRAFAERGADVRPEVMERMAAALYDQTGGHPLYAIETLRYWREANDSQHARDDSARYAIPATVDNQFVVPGVKGVIAARLARLGETENHLASVTAVVGRAIPIEQVQAIAGLDDMACLTGLDRLVAHRILLEWSGAYVFSHDSVRRVIYERAGEGRRRLLHRRTLDVLEAAGAPAGELVEHALLAHLSDRAYHLSVRAGSEALAVFASADAAKHFARARGLAETDVAAPMDTRLHVLERLGDACRLSNQALRAVESYREMLAVARAAELSRPACLALNRLAEAIAALGSAGHTEDPETLLAEALESAEAGGHLDLAAETLNSLCLTGIYTMRLEEARRVGERGLGLARASGLRDLEARCLGNLAQIGFFLGTWVEAEGQAGQAQQIFAALGNRALENDALLGVAATRQRRGELASAIEIGETVLASSREIDNAWGVAHACAHLSFALLDAGYLDRARAIGREGGAAAQRAQFAPLEVINLAAQGAAERALCNSDRAVAVHLEARRLAAGFPMSIFVELACGELCADALFAGQWQDAARWGREARLARSAGSPFFAFNRWAEAEALARAGEVAMVKGDLAVLDDQVGHSPRQRVVLERSWAAIAIAQRRYGAALAHLDRAAALAAAIGLPAETLSIELSRSEIQLMAGDRRAAGAALTAALTVIESLSRRSGDVELASRFRSSARVSAVVNGCDPTSGCKAKWTHQRVRARS